MNEIVGLTDVKNVLREDVLLAFRFPGIFNGRMPHLLLFGAPGTGKTATVKALATELTDNCCFVRTPACDLFPVKEGPPESFVTRLFNQAKGKEPCLLFIDDFEYFFNDDYEDERIRRIRTELLVQIDGIQKFSGRISLICATNVPWKIYPPFRKRFSKLLYFPLPDLPCRVEIVKQNFAACSLENDLTNDDIVKIGHKTEGYTGSDIVVLVKDALMQPVRRIQSSTHFRECISFDREERVLYEPCSWDDRDAHPMKCQEIEPDKLKMPTLTMEDVLIAYDRCRPSMEQAELEKYETFKADYATF